MSKSTVPPALNHDEKWLPESEVITAAKRNELGSSELLAQIYKNRIAYDHTEKKWYLWTGHYWEADKKNSIISLASNQLSAQYMHTYASMLNRHGNENSNLDRLMKAGMALQFRNGINNVLSLAASHPDLSLSGDEWDSNLMLLGVENGAICLKTGEHRDACPMDYLRDVAPAEWIDIDEPCPRFEQFISEIFGHDKEVVDYIQRLLGYGITALDVEHVLGIWYGEDGRNGKGVLLRTLRNVLGSYCGPVGEEVMLSGKRNPNAASPYTVMLRFLRIAHVSETDEGDRLEAGRVKYLTGGDEQTGRNLHQNPISFIPRHLLLLITNHKPHINADDAAIWERVFLIPFTQRFIDEPTEPNEHLRDAYLSEKLEKEKSGILAWLIRGCLAWQAEGLSPPMSIKAVTEIYRQSEDTLGQFIGDNCRVDDMAEIKANVLYLAYSSWSKDGNMKPMTSSAFGKRMKKRFVTRKSSGIIYIGIDLDTDKDTNNNNASNEPLTEQESVELFAKKMTEAGAKSQKNYKHLGGLG